MHGILVDVAARAGRTSKPSKPASYRRFYDIMNYTEQGETVGIDTKMSGESCRQSSELFSGLLNGI
jgi:hypothetical protein